MILKFIGLTNGGPHEASGKYLVYYDPNAHRPDGSYDGGTLLTTNNINEALDIPIERLVKIWKSEPRCPCHRTLANGQSNRPLTAFDITIGPKSDVK